MQVSQMSDAITHAVIGSAESVEMGMSDDSAHLMHLFSTALYTYPRLATVREIMCNGWDGNIMSGNTHIPLLVTITDTQLKIKDSGPGIPHEQIGKIYGTYGNSTKRTDIRQTGGFGLGSKAPFAYTDNFEVISCYGGVKTIYRISKSSMEAGGKPAINKIVALPTDETGVEVTITLKTGHQTEFTNLVKEVAILGEIPISINGGEVVETLPLEDSPTGYIVNSFNGTNLSRINVRYGNVVYPIPRKEEYGTEWDDISKGVSRLWSNANIIFMCPPDSVSIQPSRETLILTEQTIATIKDALAKFDTREIERADHTVREMNNHRMNLIIGRQDPKSVLSTLRHDVVMSDIGKYRGISHESGPYAFTLRQAAINHTVRNSPHRPNREITQVKRIKHMIANGHMSSNDIKMAKALLKAYSKGPTNHNYKNRWAAMATVINKYRVQNLLKIVNSDDRLSEERLHLPDFKHRSHGKATAFHVNRLMVNDLSTGFQYLEKKIVICRNKSAAWEWIRYSTRRSYETGFAPWFVYVAPAHEKNHAFIIKSFEDEGWTVELVDMEPRVKAERFVDPDAPVKAAATKRKGYLTLSSSFDPKEFEYTVAYARKHSTSDTTVKKPIAWTYLFTEREGASKIPKFSDEECRLIRNLWGDQIAVVASQVQANALIKKGVPDLKSFVYEYADKKLAESKDFPRYLSFIRPIVDDTRRTSGVDKVLTKMLAHPALMDDLGLRFSLSVETKMLVTFFSNSDGDDEVMPLCKALASKVKRHPMSRILPAKMKASPWAEFINFNALSIHLDCHMPNSPRTEVPYEIIRKLLA